MIQVFSAEWCSACKQVKKFLEDSSIAFEVRDIENDKEAYDTLLKLELRSIPVTYLDDSNFVVGFNKSAILELSKK
jgi:glutaredoxin